MIVCIHKTHTEGDEDKIQKVLHLYESVSCVCLCVSDESVLFCIYVWNIVVLFTCLDGPREDKLWTYWVTIFK